MRRLIPQSLFGQTLTILLAGLIVSSLVGSWIYSSDREEAVRAVGGLAVAERVINLARLVKDAPREWQTRIIEASSDNTFVVQLAANPFAATTAGNDGATAGAMKRLLVERLSLQAGEEPVVYVSSFRCEDCERGQDQPGHHEGGEGSEHASPTHEAGERPAWFAKLQISLPLEGNDWLNIATGLPEGGAMLSGRFVISMAIMAAIILAVSVWVVRRVTSPLANLARAAHRLGEDLNSPPMPEAGTTETRQAAHAFNVMQARLRAVIDSRTKTLAAISHDFRTPLTLLRLRIENVENAAERERMLSTIADLDTMVAATLEFAGGGARQITRRRTDLTALLASIVDDLADGGLPVAMSPCQPVIHECDPVTLKRAVTNLIDNAVKYGGSALVGIRDLGPQIEITVDDEGPGIPEEQLSHVLEPLYRLEESRSRETGGMGLGLAIALSIVRAHDGKLLLSNRPVGGLRASILLPHSQPGRGPRK